MTPYGATGRGKTQERVRRRMMRHYRFWCDLMEFGAEYEKALRHRARQESAREIAREIAELAALAAVEGIR